MTNKVRIVVFLIVGLNILSIKGIARTLNSVEVCRRCYMQLTQQAVKYNDPALAQVRAGTKLPITACMELLDRAKFGTNGNSLQNSADPIALSILSAMNQVHQTFFLNKQLAQTAQLFAVRRMNGIYDPGEPALFYTKALFDAATNADFVVTSNVNFRAYRTQNAPTVSTIGYNRSSSVFAGDASFTWAPAGQLLGVNPTGNYPVTSSFGNANIGTTFGGGILGSPSYLLATVNEAAAFKSNTFLMPRKWVKAVFSDFLCRELPVARLIDTNSFVSTAANANEFRKTQACTRCYASMDRLTAVNRNFRYQVISNTGDFTVTGGVFPIKWPTTSTQDVNAWPAIPTNDYANRGTMGVLLVIFILDVNIEFFLLIKLGQTAEFIFRGFLGNQKERAHVV